MRVNMAANYYRRINCPHMAVQWVGLTHFLVKLVDGESIIQVGEKIKVEVAGDKVKVAGDKVEVARDKVEVAGDKVEVARDKVEVARDQDE